MIENNINGSYYMELKKFYDKNKGELYSFQNFEKAGYNEYTVITEKIKPLKLFRQNKMAIKLVKILLDVVDNKKDYKDIEEYLNSNRVIYYYESFRKTLIAAIESHNEKRILLEQLTEEMIFNSNNKESVKLALIMAQVLEIRNLEKILDIYSIHNDFIFYTINDYYNMEGKNYKIFDIAKHSQAYGKLFALAHLKISTDEIENWIVENGCINNYGIHEIIEYSILSVNLLEYLNRVKFDNFSIEIFAKSFCAMLSDYGLYELDDKVGVCNKILEIIDEAGGGIYSLYSVISILYTVDGIIIDYYKENKNIETLANYAKYKKIVELCTDICNEPYWHDVIKEELDNIKVESDILITCIEKIEYKLKKKEYENLLKRNYFSPLLYKYALCIGSKAIRKSAFKLGIKNLPINDMTTGAEELRIENLTYEDIPYICFYILVKYSEVKDFDEDINEYKSVNLRGLQCSLIEIREECINNLSQIKNTINEYDRELICNCITKESIASIRRGLKSLIEKDSDKNNKEQLMDKKPKTIHIHSKDAFLFDTNILGKDDFNRTKVQNSLKENSIMYIMKSPIEEKDFSTVVCTANGYIIGYIEKPIDDILNNLINAERYVYCVVKKISDNLDDISVSLYLSYKDVEDGVSDVLALISKTKDYYVQ